MEPAEQLDTLVAPSPPPNAPLANGHAPAGVLDRDAFVKRRQAEREAAAQVAPQVVSASIGESDDATFVTEVEAPGAGATGEETGYELEADLGIAGFAQETETAAAVDESLEAVRGEGRPETEASAPEMTAAEREAFESLPSELHGYVERLHASAAAKAREAGDSLAMARQEVEARREALDRALAETAAIARSQAEQLPHSPSDLRKLAEEQGFEAWQRAVTENESARSEAMARRDRVTAEVEARQNEILTKFAADLPRLIPAWREPAVRQREARELGSYLRESGFNEAELRSVADARLVALARKAMRYDAALARRSDGVADVAIEHSRRNAGQPGPTGARPPRSNGNAQIDAAAQRYRDTPTADTFAELRELRRQAATNTNRWRV